MMTSLTNGRLSRGEGLWRELAQESDLAKELLYTFTARQMGKVFFRNSGSEANDSQAKLQRRGQELTHTTLDQSVDDEAVYYKLAGECPKGCVYCLRSLWRKKRRYIDPDASTSQHPQGVVGGGAGDEVGPMVVFSGLDVMENQLD
ncbi:hypothetical protein Syun_009337 [Stephania yunnanensis]|uniref:Uncharacterized protein n=1 Tax=Stephania yunnanensis TaxID=152371 RepID=A0AAP0PNF4_9MAGN